MNPWELLLLVLGWTILVLLVLVLMAVLSGFLVWVVQGVLKLLSRGEAKK